ncbi:unnamed protein product [Mytilus edulis]|uniref:Uncharacterized protein n=1 Tax=Mytilus edulis TaxID=6550 RepID=A0A8S3UAU3_MYTED|nr:unnamed protein product [Mytilus edulis]
MKNQSELFSRFLILHIGTDRIVKLRRLFLNKCVNILNVDGAISFEIIGSRSEGLDMAGSDTDMLHVMNFTAHETGEQIENTILTVEYDSLMDNIHPGYVILEEIGSSNEIHKTLITSENVFKGFLSEKQHGPAIMQTVLGAEFDHVISIKSESWPKIAMEWIHHKETLLQVLCDITITGWQWVLKSKTLERFPYFITRHEVTEEILENTVYKRDQLDTFKLLIETFLRCRKMTCWMMSKVISMNKSFLETIFKVPIVRQKTVSMLFHFIETDNKKIGNKTLYALHKFQMQVLTMESMDNLISGKKLLASWLYTNGEYNESLQVTDVGLKI